MIDQGVAAVEAYPFGALRGLAVHPRYAELRQQPGLARVQLPFGGCAWLATRYRDVRDILASSYFSRARAAGADIPRLTPMRESPGFILSTDPPEHTGLKKLIGADFSPRATQRLRPAIQDVTDRLLDRLAERADSADLVADFAEPLSLTIIGDLLGVPPGQRISFLRWSHMMMSVEGTGSDAHEKSCTTHKQEILRLIYNDSASPDGLLHLMGRIGQYKGWSSEDELTNFVGGLLIAGYDTTSSQFANITYFLLTNDALREQASSASGPQLGTAVEELLRIVPLDAASYIPRIAVEDVEVGGTTIHGGQAVLTSLAAANRDPAIFAAANTTDLTRTPNPHLAFGHGVHRCIGAQLARLVLELSLGAVLRRLPGLRLTVPSVGIQWRESLVRSPIALPVTWDSARQQ